MLCNANIAAGQAADKESLGLMRRLDINSRVCRKKENISEGACNGTFLALKKAQSKHGSRQ